MPSKPKFKDSWLNDRRFYWVSRVEVDRNQCDVEKKVDRIQCDPEIEQAQCNLCGITMSATGYVLCRHMNKSKGHIKLHNDLMEILNAQNTEITNDLLRLAVAANFRNTKIAKICDDEKNKFNYYQCENSDDPVEMNTEESLENLENNDSHKISDEIPVDQFNSKLQQLKDYMISNNSKVKEQLDHEKSTDSKFQGQINDVKENSNIQFVDKLDDVNTRGDALNPTEQSSETKSQEDKKYPEYIKFPTKLIVRCDICQHTFRNRSDKIKKHLNSKRHTENCKNAETFDPKVASAEIKLAAACAHYNMSFSLTDNFTNVVKDTVIDSELTKKIKLDRKRVRDICLKVIAPAHKRRLAKKLSKKKFSILVDESRDKSGISYLTVNARYKDRKRKKFVDSLWDIVPVYDDEMKKANADTLFNRIVDTFEEAEIDLTNIISFCSDGASVMVAQDNSVYARFKKRLPNLIRAKCNCHISNLCTKDASKVLPKSVQKVHAAIRNYISKSAQRQNNWSQLQKLLNLDPLEILQPHTIRWLSLYESTLRISRRWLALIFFFKVECEIAKTRDKKEKDNCPFKILGMLLNPKVFGYVKFLEASLSKIILFNKKFQTTKAIVPEDKPGIQNVYIYYLKRFMNSEYIDAEIASSSLSNINPLDETNYKPLEKIILGRNAELFMRKCKLSDAQKQEFCQNCRSFYVELCKQIKQRFDFDNDYTMNLRCFNVKNARNHDFHEKFQDLNSIFPNFKSIVDENDEEKKALINDEWRLLLNFEFSKELEENWKKKNDPEEFWFYLLSYENDNGQKIFSNLADFALDCIGIPNSNATPERTWSKMNLEKTKQRCKLKYPSLRAIMLSSQYVKDVGGMKLFEPTEEMIERMKLPIYSTSKKKTKASNNKDEKKKTCVEYLGRRIKDSLIFAAAMEDKRYRKPHSELVEIKDGDPDENDFLMHYLRDLKEEEDKDENNEDDFCAELLEYYNDYDDGCDEDDDDVDVDEESCYDDESTDDDDDDDDDEKKIEAIDDDLDMGKIEDFMIFAGQSAPLNDHSYYSQRKKKHLKRKTSCDIDILPKKIKLQYESFLNNLDEKTDILDAEDTAVKFQDQDEKINETIDLILLTANKSLSEKLFYDSSIKITNAVDPHSNFESNISNLSGQKINIIKSKLTMENKLKIKITPDNFESHDFFVNAIDRKCRLPPVNFKKVNINVSNTCPIDSLTELIIHSIKKENTFEQLYYESLSSQDPVNIFPIIFKYSDVKNSRKKNFSPCDVNIYYFERVRLMVLIKNNEESVLQEKRLDCQHNINHLCIETLRSSANNFEMERCSNCPYSKAEKLPVVTVNTKNVINNGIEDLNHEINIALQTQDKYTCKQCMSRSVIKSYTIGKFIFVDCEDCYRADLRPLFQINKKRIKPKLHDIPKVISVQNNLYRLSGFIAFEGQGLAHYYCLKYVEKDKWIKIDDLHHPHITDILDNNHTYAFYIATLLYIKGN